VQPLDRMKHCILFSKLILLLDQTRKCRVHTFKHVILFTDLKFILIRQAERLRVCGTRYKALLEGLSLYCNVPDDAIDSQ
jgi:hypothetical protein